MSYDDEMYAYVQSGFKMRSRGPQLRNNQRENRQRMIIVDVAEFKALLSKIDAEFPDHPRTYCINHFALD